MRRRRPSETDREIAYRWNRWEAAARRWWGQILTARHLSADELAIQLADVRQNHRAMRQLDPAMYEAATSGWTSTPI